MAEWGIRRASVSQRSFLAHGQIMQNRYLYLVLHCILLLVGSYMVVTVPSTVSFWPMPTKLNHDVDFLEFLAVWLVWMASDGIGKVGTITYVAPRIRSFDFDLAFVPGFLTVLRRLWCHICHLGHKKMKGPQIRIYKRSLFLMTGKLRQCLNWVDMNYLSVIQSLKAYSCCVCFRSFVDLVWNAARDVRSEVCRCYQQFRGGH